MTTRQVTLSRRSLLKALGGGVIVFATTPDVIAKAWAQRGQNIPQVISAWVHVGADGQVTVFTGKAEVGQNARTSLTQGVAEELRVPVKDVRVTMADTDLVPYDMGTFGSRTTPTMLPQVRRAAASAREALIDLAADLWQIDRAKLVAVDGRIVGPKQTARYGELVKDKFLDKAIDESIALTAHKDWKVLGKPLHKVDGREFVTGRHKYASDIALPGMVHAKILRPPSYHAKLVTLDTKEVEALGGVRVVHDGDFVAVAAPTVREAEAALIKIRAEWTESSQPSNKELFALLKTSEPQTTLPAGQHRGRYTCEYIAHVPLEPRAAVANWSDGKLTVYTGSQRPFGVKSELVEALGLPESKVRVIVPDTGSGYGGKHTGEAAVEAARVSFKLGVPVKLVWSRTEEFTWAYFRPAGVVEVQSSVDDQGKLQSWIFDNYNSGGAGIGMPYDVNDPHTEFHEVESPLRQGSYRALAATFNNFARETHLDEVACALGMDTLQFRLHNLTNSRIQGVLTTAAQKFGWAPMEGGRGHGQGIACGIEKNSVVATAVEVFVNNGELTIIRVVTAFECGSIVNPEQLQNQVVGSLIMGLGGALWEEVLFADGKIKNAHLSRYRVPRFTDIPKIDCVLIDNANPSAGAGETPIIAIAPALGNAIFHATGKRLRDLPFKLS